MIEIVLAYFLGAAITANIVYTWFNTTITERILGLFIKTDLKNATYKDYISKIEEKNEFLADLLSCEMCVLWWVSAAIASILAITIGWWPMVVIGPFSWPRFVHRFLLRD